MTENESILKELEFYCNEENPVGAILLTGGWGCGKSYFLDNEFKEKMKKDFAVIKVSLFGIADVEEINSAVNEAWINNFICISPKVKKIVSDLEKIFMDSSKQFSLIYSKIKSVLKHLKNIDLNVFFPVSNKIFNQKVVLIFDDLERCTASTTDILGVINNYCENKKIHTIIVANEEKLNKDNEKSYEEYKEKIIQYTIKFQPKIDETINNIINNINFNNDEYSNFIKIAKNDIIENIPMHNTDLNLRCFKTSLVDFKRIYEILKSEGIEDLKKWLINFIIVDIIYRSGEIKDKNSFNIYDDIFNINPRFNRQYFLNSFLDFVKTNRFCEEKVKEDILEYKSKLQDKSPLQKLKSTDVIHIDEEDILNGFDSYLQEAYKGKLTLNEYMIFIKNVSILRYENFLEKNIDYKKIRNAIENIVDYLIKKNKIYKTYNFFSDEEKSRLNKEEKDIYDYLARFSDTSYHINKKIFIQKMNGLDMSVFDIKNLNTFDDEMAEATFRGFSTCSNSEKNRFITEFKNLIKQIIINSEDQTYNEVQTYNKVEIKHGLNRLLDLLGNYKNELVKNSKPFALKYTKEFFERIKNILSIYLKEDIEAK